MCLCRPIKNVVENLQQWKADNIDDLIKKFNKTEKIKGKEKGKACASGAVSDGMLLLCNWDSRKS